MLLPFYIIPILMIAYPSIQEFQVGKNWLSFKKYKEQLIVSPNNTEAKKELVMLTKKLEKRAKSTEDSIEITEAYILLEEPKKAIKWANEAIKNQHSNNTTKQDSSNVSIENITVDDNLIVLKSLKEFATIQEDIKLDKNLLLDTVQLKKRINDLNSNNETQRYFNKKYLENNKINN